VEDLHLDGTEDTCHELHVAELLIPHRLQRSLTNLYMCAPKERQDNTRTTTRSLQLVTELACDKHASIAGNILVQERFIPSA
jgi:hypothetical protein